MQIGRLDHVNVVTSRLEMLAWYEAILDLRSVHRSDFTFWRRMALRGHERNSILAAITSPCGNR